MKLLHRQISPAYVTDDRPTWYAFRPRPPKKDDLGDQGLLSVSCGEMCSAENAYARFTARKNPKGANLKSAGVMSVSRKECAELDRPVIQKPVDGDDSHHLIDFKPLDEAGIELCANDILELAIDRGWSFRPKGPTNQP